MDGSFFMKNEKISRTLELSLKAGTLMLEHGAETYRVEETINRICISRGIAGIQNFTVPTGIFINCVIDGEYYSYIHRTKIKTIDLEIIALVNNFSRKFINNGYTIEEAEMELNKIEKAPAFPFWISVLSGGFAGGFFSLLFGGNLIEFLLASITSMIVIFGVKIAEKRTPSFFLKNLFGGMINTLFALLFVDIMATIGIYPQIDNIIIGSLMPLVPGVALTNALRDIISGDFVSGSSRLNEATLTAVAIAMGVGTVLQINVFLKGVI